MPDNYPLGAKNDPRAPFNEKETITRICPDCKGQGYFLTSDCCGEEPRGNGGNDSLDYGICPRCHEHCSFEKDICNTCLGFGAIEIIDEDVQNEKD